MTVRPLVWGSVKTVMELKPAGLLMEAGAVSTKPKVRIPLPRRLFSIAMTLWLAATAVT